MIAAKRPCKHVGCPHTVAAGYCEDHASETWAHDSYRGSSASRGYDYRWQRFRQTYLNNPDNVMCRDCGIRVSTDIHHLQPLDLFPGLKYDLTNLKPLCHSCHSRITATDR